MGIGTNTGVGDGSGICVSVGLVVVGNRMLATVGETDVDGVPRGLHAPVRKRHIEITRIARKILLRLRINSPLL